jgi:hypothetical protein
VIFPDRGEKYLSLLKWKNLCFGFSTL